MSIVQSVDFYAFKQAFEDFNRKDQFSPVALRALFDYLEDLSEDTGEPVELDVIGLCCDWSEMTYAEAIDAYGIQFSYDADLSERENHVEMREAVLDHFGYYSTVAFYNDDVVLFVNF